MPLLRYCALIFLISHLVLCSVLENDQRNVSTSQSEISTTENWISVKRISLLDGESEEDESDDSELPDDIFTNDQRLAGAIILHIFGVFYFFTLLAILCEYYYLPTVENICDSLHISEDIAAATFMSFASTTPEFFTNTVSIFIADSDMGLGAIMGSMLFNILGVAACAGLASTMPIHMEWYPLSRDCLVYSLNVSILVIFAWDGKIMWYEATILFVLFFGYFLFLFQSNRFKSPIIEFVESKIGCCVKEPTNYDMEVNNTTIVQRIEVAEMAEKFQINEEDEKHEDKKSDLWTIPKEGNLMQKIFWFYKWPICFLLAFIMPNPRSRLWPLTFILCILVIGTNSFMLVWLATTIGETFNVSDTVMGVTVLAWGGGLPESISAVLFIKSGNGKFGLSNPLGANSMAILMSLGLPWFIRTMADGAASTGAFIQIHTKGVGFIITFLLLAVLILFLSLSSTRYHLHRKLGLVLTIIYIIFITIVVLVQLGKINVF